MAKSKSAIYDAIEGGFRMNNTMEKRFLLGMDLGGTKLAYVLATSKGDFVYQKTYPSPYRVMSGMREQDEPFVYIDTILHEIPLEKRVARYLSETEADFLNKAGAGPVLAKGMSLCGKTWIKDGKIVMIGGNTPVRFAEKDDDGRYGIVVEMVKEHVVAANDGNAAATAQGIYYQVANGIAAKETGYIILGTGFGFGVPGYFATTEIGHIPVPLMPEALWQGCGCNKRRSTPCAENYVSGRGIATTYERLLSLQSKGLLEEIRKQLAWLVSGETHPDIEKTMLKPGKINAEMVMKNAKNGSDGMAVWVAALAAHVTAYCAVAVAYQFGLQRIGIGETVAMGNPWHVDAIARIAAGLVGDSTILRPPLTIELTPVNDPGRYGALSLVVPENDYELWAGKMRRIKV